MKHTISYCGRSFCESELQAIRDLIAQNRQACRAELSRLVCVKLDWRRPNGGLKEMSCRVAMLRMSDDGLLSLPPPRNRNSNGKPYSRRTRQAQPPDSPIIAPAGAFVNLHLAPVKDRKESYLYNEYIDRYHYLGYKTMPGDQIRYFARSDEKILALLSFRCGVWKTAPRDRFIGWSNEQRKKNLHLLVNNNRFLILPWVISKNLASRILAMATRNLPDDWQERYGYRPVLVESFVESLRFSGTCYKATNWLYLGQTKGRGRLAKTVKAQLPKKSIWVYPLVKDFRRKLCD